MKRWLIGAGVVLVFVMLALGGAYWRYDSLFYTAAPAAVEAREGASPLERQRADLDHFERLIGMDRSFSPEARADARARIATLRASEAVLDRPRLRMELRAIVALADNAHTQLYSPDGWSAYLIPLRVYGFSDGVHVLLADAPNADLLGARLTHVNGRPVADVVAALMRFTGGADAWRRSSTDRLLSVPEFLYGAGLGEDPSRVTWRLDMNGETVERAFTVRAPPDDEPQPATARLLSPEPMEGQPADRRAFSPRGGVGVALTDFRLPFRRVWIGDSCTLFLQFKSNRDEDGFAIGPFIRETRQAMRARPPCNLILDMRWNGGGDYTLTERFFRDLPALIAPEGRIYILTGVDTFSAGITSVAFVEQAAPVRTIILGEPVGDRLAFWSEGGEGCLPHAELCVRYARAKHDYGAACPDWNTCFWLNYIFPVRVRTLAPDETIAWRFADYAVGRDPVLERALALAGGS